MVSLYELGVFSGLPMTRASLSPVPGLAERASPENLSGWPLHRASQRYSSKHHGDFDRWLEAIQNLPPLQNAMVSYTDTVSVDGDVDNIILQEILQQLHPWRKGPFRIGTVHINAEWRSDRKWQRITGALGDLQGQRILDVGCGNGYFGWRMLAQGAAEVVGIDPTLLFCMQHLAIQHYTRDPRNWVLPLKIEELPATEQFDTVLSMGVIYHRRDPMQHVHQLAGLTRPGGQVILESLVIEGNRDLISPDRYARMRNVWCVPTIKSMIAWLVNAGFRDVRLVDIKETTLEEQRSTEWMRFESLAQALDPKRPGHTIEGYPAPVRAVLHAYQPTS